MIRSGLPQDERDRHHAQDAVPSITDASVALTEDVAGRMRRYMLQMGGRVVFFAGAVVIDHWIRWVLLAAAVFVPYFAVVLATVGSERGHDPGTFLSAPEPRALPAAAAAPGHHPRTGGPQ